jgi:hypothetical protein
MFHLQLRQFPHNHSQFNLTEQELHAIAGPWVRGQWLAIGERKWNAHQAKLTIVEGPRVQMAQLSMGRGWRHVQREGQDVTEQVLAAASAPPAGSEGGPPARVPSASPAGERSAPDSASSAPAAAGAPAFAANAVGSLLGGGPRAQALLAAWQETAARYPNRSPSECLELAEEQLESQAGGAAR